jgi:hypothetical protein
MGRTLRSMRSRRLETLLQRVSAMEIFILSKAWYIAHLLPLATSASSPGLEVPATRLRRLVSDFLWAGRHSVECHAKRSAGGFGLSCPQTRAQSMLAKQACHFLAAGGRPALHLAYWIGLGLHGVLPGWPRPASGWMETLRSSMLTSSPSSEKFSLWTAWILVAYKRLNRPHPHPSHASSGTS